MFCQRVGGSAKRYDSLGWAGLATGYLGCAIGAMGTNSGREWDMRAMRAATGVDLGDGLLAGGDPFCLPSLHLDEQLEGRRGEGY